MGIVHTWKLRLKPGFLMLSHIIMCCFRRYGYPCTARNAFVLTGAGWDPLWELRQNRARADRILAARAQRSVYLQPSPLSSQVRSIYFLKPSWGNTGKGKEKKSQQKHALEKKVAISQQNKECLYKSRFHHTVWPTPLSYSNLVSVLLTSFVVSIFLFLYLFVCRGLTAWA